MTPEFLITTLIVVATPGAGVLYTVAAGISRGWRASLVAAFACTLGIVPHMIAAVTGLAAIMHASAVAFSVIKLLGVAYLLYLAWKTFRDKSVFEVQTGPAKVSPWRVIVSGVLVNTLNPKLTIFFFAFLPQFVAPDRDGAVLLMVWLSAIFMAVTLVGVQHLRRVRGGGPARSHLPTTHRRVDAAQLRRHLPHPGGQARGADALTVTGQSAGGTGDGEQPAAERGLPARIPPKSVHQLHTRRR